ncbi:histone-lysine N-methyltransferase SETMAR [Trichonephila clavipes]|nr:histone-lysine N-methyltransferase SETMAR [Trichonephila clavipes]
MKTRAREKRPVWLCSEIKGKRTFLTELTCDDKWVYYNNTGCKGGWLVPGESAGSVARRTLTNMKLHLDDTIFHSNDEILNKVNRFLDSRTPEFAEGIQRLPKRWQTIVDLNGDYFISFADFTRRCRRTPFHALLFRFMFVPETPGFILSDNTVQEIWYHIHTVLHSPRGFHILPKFIWSSSGRIFPGQLNIDDIFPKDNRAEENKQAKEATQPDG